MSLTPEGIAEIKADPRLISGARVRFNYGLRLLSATFRPSCGSSQCQGCFKVDAPFQSAGACGRTGDWSVPFHHITSNFEFISPLPNPTVKNAKSGHPTPKFAKQCESELKEVNAKIATLEKSNASMQAKIGSNNARISKLSTIKLHIEAVIKSDN